MSITNEDSRVTVLPAVCVAVALPTLLAYNLSPSSTLLNQLLAVAGWGSVLVAVAGRPAGGVFTQGRVALAALGALVLGVLWSLQRALPSSLGLDALGLLGGAALVLAVAVARPLMPGSDEAPVDDTVHLARALLLAATLSALVALVQVFFPAWADGDWIARSGLPGRAVGNMRQPNHLSSLLVWGLIALVPLADAGRLGLRRGQGALAAGLGVLLVLAVVLSGSRTGMLGMGLLAVWGLVDRRLQPRVRWALLSTPAVYVLCWLLVAGWAHQTAHTFGAEVRLQSDGDLSSSRFGIWSNTLALIRAQPWMGVGFGEFNFAWTLTPFPGRPTAFFDHTHNLPLHLLVELGLPLGGLVMGLLCLALWQAARRSWRCEGPAASGQRAAFMVVLLIGVHSLLEYPLWYAYFLLPTAWALGLALRQPVGASALPTGTARWPALAGAAMVAGAVFTLQDYGRVTAIYSAGDGQSTLAQRIERGQRSLFFAHHADYAAATTTEPPSQAMGAFGTSTHSLLDTRLVTAWARALNESGHRDQARYLADRLREFRNPESQDFLAECEAPPQPGLPRPFQCEPVQGAISWRDFTR